MAGLDADAEALFIEVKRGPQTHEQLKARLDWKPERYEAARQKLLDGGLVAPKRGRGGGLQPKEQVALPKVDLDAIEKAKNVLEKEAEEAAKAREKSERDLYPYLEEWARAQGYGTVAVVGDLKKRQWWENPDLIAVDQIDLEWVVGPAVEVTTIEAKLAFDVEAVWQTANYRQFSHFVYLACFEDGRTIREKLDGRLYTQCVDLGLGVISMGRRGAGGKGVGCFEINAPRRQSPIPQEVDQLLEDYKDKIGLESPYGRILEKAATKKRR